MKYTIKKGALAFSPKLGGWRFHGGTTFAEWRGHFHDNTWYELPEEQNAYNLGSGWSYGRSRKNALLWGWRPVKVENQPMQQICLCTVEDEVQTFSSHTVLLPLQEDFFVQLKTNGTFASLAARTFTGDWQMITGKWGARPKKGFWLGLALGLRQPCPQDMALDLKRLLPA